MIDPPTVSTIHAILDRHGLVTRRRRRRYKVEGTTLSDNKAPNACGAPTSKARSRHSVRAHLYRPSQGTVQHRVCRPICWHLRGGRRHVACLLYGLRLRIFRQGFEPSRARGNRPLRFKRVIYVTRKDREKMVGTAGFEPATTTPPVWCATRLRYAPNGRGS